MPDFFASSAVFKNGLNYLTSEISHISICTSEIQDRAAPSATDAWVVPGGDAIAVSSSAGSILISAMASTTNGWIVSSSQMNTLSVSSSGKARAVCLLSGTGSTDLVFITKCTTKNLGGSDTVTIPSFNIRIADPTSS